MATMRAGEKEQDHDFYQTVKGQAGGSGERLWEIHGEREREKLGGIWEQNFWFI